MAGSGRELMAGSARELMACATAVHVMKKSIFAFSLLQANLFKTTPRGLE